MAKTRTELYAQSNSTFQNQPAGNIIPENHRNFNDDVVISCANIMDNNTFEGSNTFNSGTDTQIDGNLFANGFSQFAGNVLACNTQFKQAYTTSVPVAATIDTTLFTGNFFQLTGGGFVNAFIGNMGAVFYVTFEQQTDFIFTSAEVIPEQSLRFFANDTVIFVFEGSSQIRIIGIRRVNQPSVPQYNGQNYFTINVPQDALDMQSSGLLDVGAVYRVVSAYSSSVLDNIVPAWDVYLTAQTQDAFSNNCTIKNSDGSGACYEALFVGDDFTDGNIKIVKQSDKYASITFAKAGITSGSNSTFVYASKALIADDETGYEGYAYFDLSENVQTNNLLNIAGAGTYKFGTIKNSYIGNVFLDHYGASNIPQSYGTLFPIGAPTANDINSAMLNSGLTGITINSYVCNYQITNLGAVIHFNANVTGPFNNNPQGRSFIFWLPKPFNSNAADYGYGSLRNLTDNNHPDMGVLVEPVMTNAYFLVSAKYSAQINSAKNCIVSGCYVYAIGGL